MEKIREVPLEMRERKKYKEESSTQESAQRPLDEISIASSRQIDRILQNASNRFTAKMQSGKYRHYDNSALEQLWFDCFLQAQTMELCREL